MRKGTIQPPILQVEPPRWSGQVGLPSLLSCGIVGSLHCSAPLGSVSQSLSGLLTTPTPGSPASSGLLTAPLLLLPLFLPFLPFLPFLRPLSLLGLPASWRGARPATAGIKPITRGRNTGNILLRQQPSITVKNFSVTTKWIIKYCNNSSITEQSAFLQYSVLLFSFLT